MKPHVIKQLINHCASGTGMALVLLPNIQALRAARLQFEALGFKVRSFTANPHTFEARLDGDAVIRCKYLTHDKHEAEKQLAGLRPSFVYIDEMCEMTESQKDYLRRMTK